MQINFPTQELKDEAIAEQVTLNVTEEASAKAVYDKRVARGVKLLADLQAATVGAQVPPVDTAKVVAGIRAQFDFTETDLATIVNTLVTDPAVAAQVNAEIAAKLASQKEAFAAAVASGAVLTNHF